MIIRDCKSSSLYCLRRAIMNVKIGILGGGQLGRMLAEAGSPLNLDLEFLDSNENMPVTAVTNAYQLGNFKNYEDVLKFGKNKDILSIEIEHVNLKALFELQEEGVTVHPNPVALEIINDKGSQKLFYEKLDKPTSSFILVKDLNGLKESINSGSIDYPFVAKTRKFGYDGKGVAVIKDPDQLVLVPDEPLLIEELVDIDKEIAVIAARNQNGDITTYDPVEMAFHPTANLVEYLFAPSAIDDTIKLEARNIAHELIAELDICGLLAVEFFVSKDGDLLVNEVAPRPHNSGHHSIEACVCSQFEQHLRAISNLPLGDTRLTRPAVMVNLLGEFGHTGTPKIQGLEECLKLSDVHIHLYGKAITKPFRKMGHVTICGSTLDEAIEKAKFVRDTLKIVT
jgi:5-(carboxyamino)imidazole ribonucleotide synthase